MIAHKIVKPLAARMPVDRVFGLPLPALLAIAAIVLFCLIAFLFARTAIARKIVAGLEATLLSKLPGYEFIKNVRESILGVESPETLPVVLAHLGDTWQTGVRIEEIEGGQIAVFVPHPPNGKAGATQFVSADRILPTDIRLAAAMKCVKRYGVGSAELLGSAFKVLDAAG